MALIYIVEDDDNIREIEKFALLNAGHQVWEFACATDFYRQLEKLQPELCLLDIMLPDEPGDAILKKLRREAQTANLPVIMVTAKTSDLDLAKGMENGADDYIKKPFSVLELLARVKALLRRTQKKSAVELQLDDLTVNSAKRELAIAGKLIDLTYKEFELIYFLLANKGIVLSRDTLMDKVWGTEHELNSRTLDMHIKTLRQKLGSYGGRICTVRNVGYVIK
ncbi:response regulator transcription factor [Amygdalobacter indicium]|uniref:Stage 0 sporulation protein A homolog n=1 Tax=Amygdalobacter indicium TaxID=3029272 RepID=A0ABY8C7Z6_9FIRM|nr:response regulator transcription factor [Amygdalobacter indicium]WEG35649.1 response regulator transcription factor [Amygdalobacter indicium]